MSTENLSPTDRERPDRDLQSSRAYYDGLASRYGEIRGQRQAYLTGVERLIMTGLAGRPTAHYLDIGTGDGVRAQRLIQAMRPDRAVLVEESPAMSALARQHESAAVRVVVGNFLLAPLDGPFDVITCLWNVIGHLPSADHRLQLLAKARSLLRPGGLFFCDVNNRYNARHYGWRSGLVNALRDVFRTPGSGQYTIANEAHTSMVYVHQPFELARSVRRAGFSSHRTLYVDYRTGESTRSFLTGQILVCASA